MTITRSVAPNVGHCPGRVLRVPGSEAGEEVRVCAQEELQPSAKGVLQVCAPVRDERLAELKEETKVVPLFRGIMDLLEQMKLDMANFTIRQVRPVIVSQSVEYEKLKFREFLETREGEENGLVSTREWLTRYNPTEEELNDPKYRKLLGQWSLNDSFVELLQ